MKKCSKILAFVVGASFSVSTLAGCSSNGLSIYNATKNLKSSTSAEVQTDITLKVSAKNMSAQEKKDMSDALTKLNGAEIHVLTKFNQNVSKTILKAQTDINAKTGTDSFQTSIWTNSDTSNSKPSSTEIIKFPKSISDRILQVKGKDYVIATSDGDVQANPIDYNKISALEPKLTAFIETYMKNYNPVIDPIKSLGNKTITQNGKQQNVKLYQLTLNDSDLKTLLHYTINNLSANKESFGLLKDCLTSVVSLVAPSKDEATDAIANIENAFNYFNSNLPAITKQLDSKLSAFDKIRVLGDKGISIQFAIDNNGYIVNEQGDIQLVIDTANINKVIGDTSSTATGIYTADLHFNNDIRNINGNVNITYPKTTTDNSTTMKLSSLFVLVDIYNTHDMVDEAIKSNDEKTIGCTKDVVSSLPDGKDKTSMLTQLNDAANNLLSAKAKDLIKKAKTKLLLSDYENAYNVTNQLPKSMNKSLLVDLTSISNKVYTSDVNAAFNTIKTFADDKNKDLKKFDTAKQSIVKSVKVAENRDYLLSKLSSVENKEVFTTDVVNALNIIDIARNKYTDTNVKAAQLAISKVKNKESAKYIQGMLDSIQPKTKK